MVQSLAAIGVKPDEVLGNLLGPWGASSPQTDVKRHEMEKLLSSASADSSETRLAKQELEKLLDVKQSSDDPQTDADPEARSKQTDSTDD